MANISVRFFKNGGAVNKDIAPKKPHAGRHGEFIWIFKNEFGSPVEVDLRDFKPPDFVDIETTLPVHVPDGRKGVAVATVINANDGDTTVSYAVYVNGTQIDPDLVIDGDHPFPPLRAGKPASDKEKGGKKKGGKKKGGKKKGTKKAAKKR
jgi:hypothetical protein